MIHSWNDLLPMLPEIFLLGFTSLILIAGLYIDEKRRGLVHFLATLALVFTAILTLRDFNMGERVLVAGGMFIRDGMGDVLKLFVYLSTAIVFVYAKFFGQPFAGAFFLFKGTLDFVVFPGCHSSGCCPSKVSQLSYINKISALSAIFICKICTECRYL